MIGMLLLQQAFLKYGLSVGSAELVEEQGTKVRFQPVISVPGCSDSLKLLGTVGSAELVEEQGTKVRFQPVISVPGCSDSLKLLGTGL
ncbi:uncharacterized protein [Aristolochia californica]|uniref:uncharacterized protein isoform X2 n=1 Tax=Aristolochia californica TaxID=171875 RepID=UPI0035DBB963